MALFSTHGVKMRPDLPYMTGPEQRVFTHMRKNSALSFFRVKMCDRVACGKETLKHKKFCSRECMELQEKETLCRLKKMLKGHKILSKTKK